MIGITPAWFQLRHHKAQDEVWRSTYRFKALACGRGSGKTEIARRYIVRMLPVRKPWSDPIYVYCLPTYNQGKRVAWVKIMDLIPRDWIESINVNSLQIRTKFGSSLYIAGLDNPARIEGSQYDGIIIDESSDIRPGVFDRSILPALAHRTGFCWRIGVPKRYGIGAIEYKEFFDKGMIPNEEGIKSWTWPSKDILTPEEMALAKKVLNEADFREQYEASWESAGGAIFHAFNHADHVTPAAKYNPGYKILVGSDFNVSPMAWVLAHVVEGKLIVFDEIFLRNTNTPNTLSHLYHKYHTHTAGWEFYGDATGRNRKTSAVTSDYIQIRNDQRFQPKQIFYPRKNPAILNRFSACNSVFKNAAGDIRCFINPRCEKLIYDLTVRAYLEGTREPDDALDIGHISDAFGYLVYKLYPVRGEMGLDAMPQGRIFLR